MQYHFLQRKSAFTFVKFRLQMERYSFDFEWQKWKVESKGEKQDWVAHQGQFLMQMCRGFAANIMNAHISKITRESWLIAVYVKCPMSLLFSGWLYGLYDKQRNPKYKHFTLNIFVFTIFTGQWIYVSWSLECDGHRQLAGLHHFHVAAFVCNPVYIFSSVSQFVFWFVSWIFIWQGRKR